MGIPSQAEQIKQAYDAMERRIKELRESSDKVDNIQAVLMEGLGGGWGTPETEARIKAVAIYTLMQERK